MKGTTGINMRRMRAKEALEAQIQSKTKPEKINKKTTNKRVLLTNSDITRINKEIEILSNPRKK